MEANISPSQPEILPKAGSDTVLFSAVKNEAPFLLEWVAYHKSIGFDQIVICSNPSNDGTEELLGALAGAGVIRHIQTVPTKACSPQWAAARAFSRRVGFKPGDWYLWLDADEFLNVQVGDRTVHALIDAIGERQGLLVNWRIFGSSGLSRFPGRFIASEFTGAAQESVTENQGVKTIFRVGPGILGFAGIGIHRPLIDAPNLPGADVFLTGNGQPVNPDLGQNDAWLNGGNSGKSWAVTAEESGWKYAQINHYAVRTPEYFELKRLRGRGWSHRRKGKVDNRHTDAFFQIYDRNEAEDRSIQHWAEATSEGIARFLHIPAVAKAAGASSSLVKDLMSQIAPPTPVPEPSTEAAPPFQLTFPEAESAYVQANYPKAKVILEYGSGGSTVLAAEAGCSVISVESDKAWAARLADHLAPISDRARVHYADIGSTGAWGVPKSPRAFAKFHSYALSVWDRPDFEEPDLVLIDGRFRASCLVAVMLRAKRPTTVLFDDYARRRYYHGVEKLARKEEMIGRMARFTVTPGAIPPDMVTQAIGWFTDQR